MITSAEPPGGPKRRDRAGPGSPVRRLAKRSLGWLRRRLVPIAARLHPRLADPLVRAAAMGGRLVGLRPDGAVVALEVARARGALEDGQVAEARTRVDALLANHPDDLGALELRREVVGRQGELTEVVRTLHRASVLDPSADRLAAERFALGRLIETSEGWLPRIPGPARPVVPAGEDVALHLLKESAPALTNGFTMRSRYNLIAAREAGLSPVVVTSLGYPRSLGLEVFDPVELVDEIPHHRLDLGSYYPERPPFDMALEHQAWLTAGVARRVRPAVIHASSGRRGYETALVGLALRAHVRRPLVYEVRSFFEATWSGDERWGEDSEHYRRRYATETRAMMAADHVITIAETMRGDIVERGVPAERVTVIANGVDADVFAPRPRDPEAVRRHGLEGAFVFGYVSNLDYRRENQELLVRVTAILRRRGREVRCLIVGDGSRRALLEDAARQSGVGDWVVFTGQVPHVDITAYYALLDAFVVPRRDERTGRNVTPLKPYEALAMERPLVVADLPALAEIVGPDRGLVFPADDAEALADVLERLMDDPALGSGLGRAGREWVRRERSWAANGHRIREVYREVLDRWAATPEVG